MYSFPKAPKRWLPRARPRWLARPYWLISSSVMAAAPTAPINHFARGTGADSRNGAASRRLLYVIHADARRSQISGTAPAPVSPDPGADAGAELHHPAGDLRRPDGNSAVDGRAGGVGGGGDRIRSLSRWRRRPRGAHDQGPVEIRRGTRQ